jgi:hypothetical protein
LQGLADKSDRIDIALFAEGPGRILVTIDPKIQSDWEAFWEGFSCVKLGAVTTNGHLRIRGTAANQPDFDLGVESLTAAWTTPLPIEEDWTPNE